MWNVFSAQNMTRAIAVSATLAAVAAVCSAQQPISGAAGTMGTHQANANAPASRGTPSPLDSLASDTPYTGKQKQNGERQRRLVSDTQRLLALTGQLKEEVASSGAEAMTPEMLKQMDEIQKLAKSVKDKMRD